MKSYLVEVVLLDGSTKQLEIFTEDLEKYMKDYSRVREVSSYTVLKEDVSDKKNLLLG